MFVALGLIYFLPTIIALVRRDNNMDSIFVLNLFLGWTCLFWVVTLAMSLRGKSPAVR